MSSVIIVMMLMMHWMTAIVIPPLFFLSMLHLAQDVFHRRKTVATGEGFRPAKSSLRVATSPVRSQAMDGFTALLARRQVEDGFCSGGELDGTAPVETVDNGVDGSREGVVFLPGAVP